MIRSQMCHHLLALAANRAPALAPGSCSSCANLPHRLSPGDQGLCPQWWPWSHYTPAASFLPRSRKCPRRGQSERAGCPAATCAGRSLAPKTCSGNSVIHFLGLIKGLGPPLFLKKGGPEQTLGNASLESGVVASPLRPCRSRVLTVKVMCSAARTGAGRWPLGGLLGCERGSALLTNSGSSLETLDPPPAPDRKYTRCFSHLSQVAVWLGPAVCAHGDLGAGLAHSSFHVPL